MDRRRILFILTFAFACLGLALPAGAEMCEACSDQMYPLSFGKCERCGQETLSVELSLCPACSEKLDQCEHCRRPLHARPEAKKPPQPAPTPTPTPAPVRKAARRPASQPSPPVTTQPAAAEAPASEPSEVEAAKPPPPVKAATQPTSLPTSQPASRPAVPPSTALTPVTAERREALLGNVDAFTLTLRYVGPKLEPYRSLTLSVPPEKSDLPANPAAVTLSVQQAINLIERLADNDWLARAADVSKVEAPSPRGPCYALTVQAGDLTLYQKLEWSLPMVNLLDSLAAAVDAEPSAALRDVLDVLDRDRQEWEAVVPVNGMRMRVYPAKPAFKLGEPVLLNITIENMCDDPLAFYTGNLLHFWTAEVVGAGARREFRLPPPGLPVEDAFQTVEAGDRKTITVSLSDIGPHRWQFVQPGVYRVNLIHDIQPEQLGEFRRRDRRVIGKWIGQIVTNTATITIVP